MRTGGDDDNKDRDKEDKEENEMEEEDNPRKALFARLDLKKLKIKSGISGLKLVLSSYISLRAYFE